MTLHNPFPRSPFAKDQSSLNAAQLQSILLCEMLCARFSHDLAGPIGAVSNGIELLEESDNNLKNQAISLIASSAKETVARLKFFRYAYGVSADIGEADYGSLREIVVGYFDTTKIKLQSPNSAQEMGHVQLSHHLTKAWFNVLIIVASCLLQGGQITTRFEAGNEQLVIAVRGEGQKLKLHPEIAGILLDKNELGFPMDKRNVQIYYTGYLLEKMKAKLALTHDDHHVGITIIKLVTV